MAIESTKLATPERRKLAGEGILLNRGILDDHLYLLAPGLRASISQQRPVALLPPIEFRPRGSQSRRLHDATFYRAQTFEM